MRVGSQPCVMAETVLVSPSGRCRQRETRRDPDCLAWMYHIQPASKSYLGLVLPGVSFSDVVCRWDRIKTQKRHKIRGWGRHRDGILFLAQIFGTDTLSFSFSLIDVKPSRSAYQRLL